MHAWALILVVMGAACSRERREASPSTKRIEAVIPASPDAAPVLTPDAGASAPARFVEPVAWGRGGEPVDGCRGEDKRVGPAPLPDGSLVRFVDYHHSGSRGVLIGIDGSVQLLDRSGKIWTPAGHLTARRVRQVSRALSRVALSTLFPAYFTIRPVPDQGGISIAIPEGAEVRGIYISGACDVPEFRELIPLLTALAAGDR